VHDGQVRIDRLGGGRRPLFRVGLIAAAFAGALVLVYYLTVLTVPGRRVADASLRGALLTGPGLRTGVDAVLNVVSVGSLLGAMAAVAVVALFRLDRLRGLAAIGILLGSNLTTWLLKEVLLVRPDLGIREVAPASLNSLPSGHTTAAFSVLAALLFVGPPRWRLALTVVGGAYVTLTALATMSAGWHRAGDSIAAFAVVGLWTSGAALAVVLAGPTSEPPITRRPAGPTSMRWLAAAMAGSLALGLLTSIALAVTPTVLDSTAGRASAFLAGGLLIIGSVTAALLGVRALLVIVDSARLRIQ
jgi:membrane-associated phospholipid phosphatase